ncbi:MAG: hypothetical protein IT329_22770 [Caldilineaceae bacterium]|nr:hypothetical protein [Caldilineaceae bacterium]
MATQWVVGRAAAWAVLAWLLVGCAPATPQATELLTIVLVLEDAATGEPVIGDVHWTVEDGQGGWTEPQQKLDDASSGELRVPKTGRGLLVIVAGGYRPAQVRLDAAAEPQARIEMTVPLTRLAPSEPASTPEPVTLPTTVPLPLCGPQGGKGCAVPAGGAVVVALPTAARGPDAAPLLTLAVSVTEAGTSKRVLSEVYVIAGEDLREPVDADRVASGVSEAAVLLPGLSQDLGRG